MPLAPLSLSLLLVADLCGGVASLSATSPAEPERRLAALRALANEAARGDATPACAASFEATLRDVAIEHHKSAQRNKRVAEYELARAAYDTYFAAPRAIEGEHAERLAFFHAELLWDVGAWPEAAEAYRAFVRRWPTSDRALMCAYNEVLAREKIVLGAPAPSVRDGVLRFVVDEQRLPSPRPPRSSPPFEDDLSDVERDLVAALVAYEQLAAKHTLDEKRVDELRAMLFKHASVLHSHRAHRAEGVRRFRELIERWPDSTQAENATRLLRESDAASGTPVTR